MRNRCCLNLLCLYIFPFSRIRIQAINEIGAGPFSQFIKAKTRPLPPLPPRLECAAAGPQSLKLKWGDSNAKAHAADDMVYTLQLEDRNKRWGGDEGLWGNSMALSCGWHPPCWFVLWNTSFLFKDFLCLWFLHFYTILHLEFLN